MLEVVNFTKQKIENLPPKKALYFVKDSKINGLRLCVFPSGVKTFILYRKVKGKPYRIKLGRSPDITIEMARDDATELNAIIARGGNPFENRKSEKNEVTFQKLYNNYYSQHAALHNKRPIENKKMIDFHIMPKIGQMIVSEITSEKIRKLHASIGANNGRCVANRVMTLVNAIFNFGIRYGYYKLANPCYGLTKFREISRDRFLSSEELKIFFDALSQEDSLFRDYFSILLFTGARKSNVLSMRWDDIDFDIKRWRIPETQTKNSEVNTVYLSEKSLKILYCRKEAQNESGISSPYVFNSTGKQGYLNDPKRSFKRIKKRMAIDDIRMHDLRRTLASYMAISGASLPIIGKALNHKSQASTTIYARLDISPVADAVEIATERMLLKAS